MIILLILFAILLLFGFFCYLLTIVKTKKKRGCCCKKKKKPVAPPPNVVTEEPEVLEIAASNFLEYSEEFQDYFTTSGMHIGITGTNLTGLTQIILNNNTTDPLSSPSVSFDPNVGTAGIDILNFTDSVLNFVFLESVSNYGDPPLYLYNVDSYTLTNGVLEITVID